MWRWLSDGYGVSRIEVAKDGEGVDAGLKGPLRTLHTQLYTPKSKA